MSRLPGIVVGKLLEMMRQANHPGHYCVLPVGEDVVYEIDDVQLVVEGRARDGDRDHGA